MKINLLPVLLPLAWCCLAGCPQRSSEKPQPPTTDTEDTSVSKSGYKRYTMEALPAIEDYLPPLDEGRVEVAPPAGWKPLSRSSRSLASFVKGKPSELPRIVVKADDAPSGDLGDTTEDNVEELSQALDTQLRKNPKKRVHEDCLPIMLGERMFVRHVRAAALDGDPAVIQSLQTVVGGRLYTVELICDVNAADQREYVKSLKDFRAEGYTVAAHLKFGGESPVESAPVETAPAEAAPSESVPAETKAKP